MTTRRIPHPENPTEVRRAFQGFGAETDVQDGRLSTLETDVAAAQADIIDLDVRIDALEATEDLYSAQAAENITAGFPIYGLSGLVQAGVARSDTAAKSRVRGLALATVTTGNTVSYIASGKVTIADWTAIIGAASLTPNAVYYLADTGGLTATAPTAVGKIVTQVGRAASTTIFNLDIKRPILL